MSDYRFGVDGYRLNYYPHDGVYDEQEGIYWSKVERVEIDWVDFVRERTCRREKHGTKMDGSPKLRCSLCGYGIGDKRWSYCPKCGAKVVER